jgi:uncharacterized membrane protein
MPKLWVRLRISFAGAVLGLVFFCLSLTPSLLPRGYVLQGVVTGVTFAIGYGIGVALAHVHRKLPVKYRITVSARFKKWTIGLLLIVTVVFLFLGIYWQDQVRKLTQATPASRDYVLRIVIIAALLVALIIAASRGIRRMGRWFGRRLSRFVPPKVSFYGGGFLAAVLVYALVSGVLVNTVAGVINYAFGLKNGGTPPGIHQPQDPIFSGSPASAIDWNTLGEKGREFVAQAPTVADIEKFSGAGKAVAPSRLYVGLESATTVTEQVNLLIKELNRTKAYDRKAVLIAIPTGSGGIDGRSVRTVEYLFGGDTTTMGIQYSYLPSWLSFLADAQKVRDAGKGIVNGVYDWWSQLDPAHRPRLLMYGESLGTLGADGAFTGPEDMANRMSGVLLAGPPNSNTLWTNMVAHRDPGTPQILPIYQNGQVVRFGVGTDPFTAPSGQPWGTNRIGILQNGSDPVVWGGGALLLHKPDWLREPRAADVSPNVRWYPFVTFWQVAGDLPFAFNMTAGHGHRYDTSMVAAWSQVLDMPLSSSAEEQLRSIIES